jgi:hypothetical protein|tara:strand:+ start:3205 stop:3651 length:447 start_codon:yes stop_codon:yes gene_type:complete
MGEAFGKGLVMALLIGIVSLIGFLINWIRFKNREKLLEEDEKNSFLEEKFKHLLNTKEGKKEITDILVSQPFSSNKPWVVYKTMKWGTWPINNNEENEIHFSITDEELQNLEEYIEFKGQIKSKEINALTSDSSAENSIDNTWSNNIK